MTSLLTAHALPAVSPTRPISPTHDGLDPNCAVYHFRRQRSSQYARRSVKKSLKLTSRRRPRAVAVWLVVIVVGSINEGAQCVTISE